MSAPDQGDPTAVDGAGDLALGNPPDAAHHDAEDDEEAHGVKKDEMPSGSRRFFPR